MSGQAAVSSSRRARTAALLGATTALATLAALSAGSVGPAQAADWVPYSDTTSVVVSGTQFADPTAVIDGAGRGTAVWVDPEASGLQLEYALRDATASPDAWSGAQQLTHDANASIVGSPQLAVDSTGRVTAAWVQHSSNGDDVYVSDRSPGGTWSEPTSVSDPDETALDLQVAVNDVDSVALAWTSNWHDGDGDHSQIQAVRRTSAMSTWSDPAANSVKTVSYDNVLASHPRLAGGDNKFVAGWTQAGAAPSDPRVVGVSQLAPGVNEWAQKTTLTDPTEDGDSTLSDVAMDAEGTASATWLARGSGNALVFGSVSPVDSDWTHGVRISGTGQGARNALLAVNPEGKLLASWSRFDGSVFRTQVSWFTDVLHNSWTTPQTLDTAVETTDGNADPVDAVVDDNGDPTVLVGTGTGSSQAFRRSIQDGAEVWNRIENAQPASAVGLSRDDAGDVATYSMRMPADGSPDVVERIFDNSGPVGAMTPLAASYRTLTIHPAWSATDLWSGIAGYQTVVSSAPWNGTFGTFSQWLAPSNTLTTAPFTGAKGGSYCFAVVPTDTADNVGAQSPSTCTTFPLDDRSMTRSTHIVKRKVHGKVRRVVVKDWASGTSSAAYARTLTTSSRKGSSLTLSGVRAQTLQLHTLAAKGSGSVTGYFNGVRLGTWSLNRSKTAPLVITMHTFPAVTTGTLVLKVASTGKPVRIDGVGTLKSS